MINRFLSPDSSQKLLQSIKEGPYPYLYDYEKHRVILQDGTGNDVACFRLPIVLSPAMVSTPSEQKNGISYLILLIQSGSCAMGYFENGVNLDHKVYRAYMVRKKQGMSQIKYLKTKGKSRAGSRVRLGKTVEFFENINERLQDYFATHEVGRIAISCPKILIPYLFNSKAATPFEKKDARILKIPKHVHTPTYEILMDIHKFLLKGELIYEETRQEIIETQLLASL